MNPLEFHVTPTTIPSSRQGWKTFIDPSGHYSVNIPSSWSVYIREIRHRDGQIFDDISLIFSEGNREYKIQFMSGGRGGPEYDFEKYEKINYGGRKGKKQTLYRADKPFESFISFDDYNSENDPFVGIDVEIPSTNTSYYLSLFEEIFSTLKFLK